MARWRRASLALAVFAALLLLAGGASAAPRQRPGRVLLKMRAEPASARRDAAGASIRRLDPRRGSPLEKVYVRELGRDADVASAVAACSEDRDCIWAQPDYEMQAHFTPDDPFLFSRGSWGQEEPDLWGLLAIDAPSAWSHALGLGVLVGVVDTGVDYDHPDLAANVYVNPGEDLDGNGRVDPSDRNGLDDDGNGFVDDLRGYDFVSEDADPFDDNLHGTHVAGTIAAVGANGLGIIGVAPGAKILPVKALDRQGIGSTSTLARAIVYAAENGARVINNSWGCVDRCPSQPALEEAVRAAHALGAVVVFSAGNSAADVASFSPQNLPEPLVVAASTPADGILPESNFGDGIDVAAPGGGSGPPPPDFPAANVLSLRSRAAVIDPRRVVASDYLRLGGTSMAAAHVSGLVALLRERHPALSNEGIADLVRATAHDIGGVGPDPGSGAGRIDAGRALALEAPPDVRVEIGTPVAGAFLHQRDGVARVIGSASGADFLEFALFFRESGGGEWSPIGSVQRTRVEDALLAEWPLLGLRDGAYTLRLVVRTRQGLAFERLVRVALVSRDPVRLSNSPFESVDASVFGDLVAWWDRIGQTRAQSYLLDVALGRLERLAPDTTFARSPQVFESTLVWTQLDTPGLEVFLCDYERASGLCPERQITDTFAISDLPRLSGARLVWNGPVDVLGGHFAIFTCVRDPSTGECPRQRVTFEPGDQIAPAVDGSRIAWQQISEDGGPDVQVCDLDPDSGTCPARTISLGGSDIDVSGDRVVWADDEGVVLCLYDPARGCEYLRIEPSAAGSDPAVSGDRVAWVHRTRAEGPRELYVCEHDAIRGTCPAQRVGASLEDRIAPDVHENRVVWSERVGDAAEVFLTLLPDLTSPGDRVVRAGRELRVPVASVDPAGVPLALLAEQANGRPLEELGATFEDFGDGAGLLRWTPASRHVGSHAVTLAGRDATGFTTSETMRIEVQPPNRPPVADAGPTRRARAGEIVTVNGCASFDPDGDPLEFRWTDRQGRVLGRSCALLAPPHKPGAQVLFLRVDDGELADVDRMVVIRQGGRR